MLPAHPLATVATTDIPRDISAPRGPPGRSPVPVTVCGRRRAAAAPLSSPPRSPCPAPPNRCSSTSPATCRPPSASSARRPGHRRLARVGRASWRPRRPRRRRRPHHAADPARHASCRPGRASLARAPRLAGPASGRVRRRRHRPAATGARDRRRPLAARHPGVLPVAHACRALVVRPMASCSSPSRGAACAVDVERAIGAPVVAPVSHDPSIPRAVDAGLLRARVPRLLARELRGAA